MWQFITITFTSMMNMIASTIKSWIRRIVFLGVIPGMPARVEQTIRITNQVALFAWLESFFHCIYWAIVEKWWVSAFAAFFICPPSFTLLMNFKQRTTVAKVVLFASNTCVGLTASSLLYGLTTGMGLNLLAALAVAGLMFNRQEEKRVLYGLSTVLVIELIVLSLYLHYNEPFVTLPKEQLLMTWVISCIFSSGAIIVSISYLLKMVHQTESELQETNMQIIESNRELEQLIIEKSELMNIVTHGLKSNIFGVRSLADSMTTALAGGAVPHNTAPLAEMSGSISRAATQMFSLVTNLLTVNAAEQGLMKPTLAKTNVGVVVQSVCEQFREFAGLKNITLRLDVPQNEALYANADSQMLREVLENLISNAVKYSPHGKTVVVRLKASNEAVRVEVQDEGEGISSEDMTKLFGKFARLSARPTGGEHSTGLGLSIVKKMVEAMNGRAWCESEVGKGATFIVELPQSENGENVPN